jgi:hypothetical protein
MFACLLLMELTLLINSLMALEEFGIFIAYVFELL